MPSRWDPPTYERHRTARERPATDLLALLEPAPGGSAVDLGCGTGRITRRLHRHVGAASTTGIDDSPEMLAAAVAAEETTGVRFELADLRSVTGTHDVIFSNAALHWLADEQAGLVTRLCSMLVPGGQLAIQVPSNFDHPSHLIADEVGRAFGLPPLGHFAAALPLRRYAELLHAGGLVDLDVTTRIYGDSLARTDDLISWVEGTTLTPYRAELGEERYSDFLTTYRDRLLTTLDDPDGEHPYFYAFSRTLVYGRAAGPGRR